jgi:hypothetical protein
MKSIHDLGYFERQILIDKVGRAIAASQCWQVDFEGNILEVTTPRLMRLTRLEDLMNKRNGNVRNNKDT